MLDLIVSIPDHCLYFYLVPLSSCFKVLIYCNRQTTTTLFAALSAGTKTYFL